MPILPINETLANESVTNETIEINETNATVPMPQLPINESLINATTTSELNQKILELESRLAALEDQIEKVNGSVIITLG